MITTSVAPDTAKAAVEKAIASLVQEIEKNLRCNRHDRVCYVKYNGEHGAYTHENLADHAKLLVSPRWCECSHFTHAIFVSFLESKVSLQQKFRQS